ncbi:MAG: flavodoxin-dependent (E)-4-hydroxy-3-methylbut-2-enyl-diphosphate synthase [Clostridia bacterium]|nr:flavodoxin-dependent (E)-4-hydroxy-3-methylbut-2-enyl-diphosphate synthase [Clostridia bacterium]
MTREISIGKVKIGHGHKIAIQSMTNTDTKDIKATIQQTLELEEAGCDIVRVSIFDHECVKTIGEIKKVTSIPLVADIHYDYSIAIASIKSGVDKIRINPGNIGSKDKVIEIINAAKEYGIPIRVGVNCGSLPEKLYEVYKTSKYDAMMMAVKEQIDLLEEQQFINLVISAKSSNVLESVKINQLLHERYDYPLHLGVTEAGTFQRGSIKSSVAFGILLSEGIGDTIRVSLTDDPVKEVEVGREILKSLGKYDRGIDIISCPTCGRTNIDLIRITNEIEEKLKNVDKKLTVAVMGCGVNGPNEAKNADIGIAGGKHEALLFKKGKIIRKIKEEDIISQLLMEIDKL